MKQYKFYRESNYIVISDNLTQESFYGFVKEVQVDKSNANKPSYKVFNVKDFDSSIPLVIEQLLKEDGSPYTESEFDTFYTQNTGNFNGGGSAPGVQSVTGSSVDNTDPSNPVINTIDEAPNNGQVYGRKDGNWEAIISGGVESVSGLTVDNTDPINPIINAIGEAPVDGNQYVRQDNLWSRVDADQAIISSYSPVAGVINSGDSAQLAIEKLDGNLQNAAIYLPEQGLIISDNFNRASLGSDYINTGTASFSIVSNQLQVSRTGGFSTSNYITYTPYGNCNLEAFTVNLDMTVGTINSTSYGVGLVFQSNGSFNLIPGGKNSVQIGISLDSANLGKIAVYNNNALSTTFLSSTGLPIVTGDLLKLTVKFIKDKFLITLLNTNTGKVNTFEYDIYNSSPYGIISPNAFRFGILALGGTHLVDNFQVVSNDSVGISYLLCGDSITKGLSSDNIVNRWGELLNNNTTTSTQTNAGGGNCIEDLNINEILSLAPKNIIILIGVNNFQRGDSLAIAQGKYQNLVNSLTASGYILGNNLFLCQLTPYSTFSSNITSFNSWLVSTYGINTCIDFFTPLANGNALRYTIDQIHPDNEGHRIMANVIINKFNLPSRIKKVGAQYPVYYNNNGKLVLGNENARSYTPIYQVEVINKDVGLTSGAQLRFGNSLTDNGGYLFSNQSDSAGIFGGMVYFNSSFVAKAVNIGGILATNGDINIYSQKSQTVGSNITPITRLYISGTNGNVGINTITPSTSAQLQIDSTTKGFLPPRMTNAQRIAITSPAVGLIVFCTDNPEGYYLNKASGWTVMLDGENSSQTILSSASTLTLSNTARVMYYTYTGSTPATWTMPTVSGNSKLRLVMYNTGTGTVTVNTNAGGNDIYDSGTLVNTTTVNPGTRVELFNNSANYIMS